MAENKKSSINNKSTCHLLNIKQPERVANRLKFTFQRTTAVISLLKLDKNVEASISMVDISEAGAGVFTSELLLKGSTVELCLTEPRILKVKCLVAWSVPVQSGIHNKRHPFRSGLQFVFQNEMQRSAVMEFIQKINTDPLENMKTSINEARAMGGSNSDGTSPEMPATPTAPTGSSDAAAAPPVASMEVPAEAAANAVTGNVVSGETTASEATPATAPVVEGAATAAPVEGAVAAPESNASPVAAEQTAETLSPGTGNGDTSGSQAA